MAINDPNNSTDKERIKILEQQNELYKKQLLLQEEGYSLSISYVESLKEVLGIRSKQTTGDKNLLSINKQLNKAILDQKSGFDRISDLQKQITKNSNLLRKSTILQTSLEKTANKDKVEAAIKEFNTLANLQNQREELIQGLQDQKDLTQSEVELIQQTIQALDDQINNNEENLRLLDRGLGYYDKQLVYAKLNSQELQKQNEKRKEELEYLKEREKSLGLTGKLTKALSDIPGLREIFGDPEYMKQVNERIDNIYNKTGKFPGLWRTLGIQIGVAGKMLLKSFTDPLVLIGLMVKGFLSLDKAQTDFARETGRQVAHLDTINASLISSADYIKQATALTKQFGFAADLVFTKETIQEATEMVELMGLSADEAGRLAMLSKVNGKELKNVSENIVKQVSNFNRVNKTAISQKAILQDVAKVSDSIAMTFGGNPEKIAAAATEARKLGLTLESVDRTAESLLNFEQSINNEISAELITGKALNLEKARLYALNDDIASLTKEIGTNEGIISGYVSGNRIQRQAIADAIGMSKDDLAKMIYQQQIQKGLTEEQAAKAAGVTLEDMKRLSLQESINKSVEKMGQALAGPLQALASMVEFLAKSKILWLFLGGVAIVKTITGIASLIQAMKVLRGVQIGAAIASGLSAAFSSPASLLTGGIAGLALGAIITAAIMNSVKSAESVGDLYSPAKGKTRVSTKEGGLFDLSNNDSLFAFPESKIKTNPNNTTPAVINNAPDLSPLLEEMKALRQEQAKSNKKPTVIENTINGTRFGTAVTMNTYKTQ